MATIEELHDLATHYGVAVEGRDHRELVTALERRGVAIPGPALPQPERLAVEWQQVWNYATVDGKTKRFEVLDAPWETLRVTDRGEAEALRAHYEQVWPHGRVRLRSLTG